MNLTKYVFLLGAVSATLYAAPQLALSTTALGPINIPQGTNGPVQTVTATGVTSISTIATATWLSASVVNATAIQIALNTAGLAPGSYTEFVIVSSPGAIDAPQNISVTVQIGGVPNSISLYAAPGATAVSQTVLTQSRVTTAVTGGNFLSVSLNQQGSFTTFYPYLVTATPQAGQTAGDYTGTVTFTGAVNAADNKAIAVTLHLTTSPIQQFSPSALSLYSSPGAGKVTGNVTVTNTGQGTLTISGATGSTNWLTASVTNNSTIAVTADPTGLAAGGYQATITLQSNAANATAVTLPVELIVLPSSAPQINFRGVVDNATSALTLAPGMISQLYGLQLAGPTPAGAVSLPLSTTLAGVQVSVNGIPAPVYYVSPQQVDFVVPNAVQPGSATVTLTYNGVSSNTVSATIAARAPRILYFPLTEAGLSTYYGVIINSSDGSLPIPITAGYNGHPAKAGDTLTVYVLGMGATNQTVADGAASPSSPLAITPTPTVNLVGYGGPFGPMAQDAVVQYSGLTPGSTSLYQVNVTLPADTPIADAVALQIFLNGVASNTVYLAVSK